MNRLARFRLDRFSVGMNTAIPANAGTQDTTVPAASPGWYEIKYLDALPMPELAPPPGALYSELEWPEAPTGVAIERVGRSRLLTAIAGRGWPLAGRLAQALSDVHLACRLWARNRDSLRAALIEHDRSTVLFCLLRSLARTKGKIVLFGFHLYPSSGLRKILLRRAIAAADVCVVWSRRIGEHYSRELDLPPEHFVVVPYKANHSQWPREARLFSADYVFAGGDSERDYRTLLEAVEGLSIPVLISTTNPAYTRGTRIPANVVLLRVQEPYFQRLMMAARLVVIPLLAGRLRGAGEGSLVNAMWHGRPVICADDVSAPEYIENGIDGLVVPPGDAGALRSAILSLWEQREQAEAMGRAARAKMERGHDHRLFCERLVKLGCLLRRDGVFRPPPAAAGAGARGSAP
jgi:glycosyltransferase involved in cell wall biosynthesis